MRVKITKTSFVSSIEPDAAISTGRSRMRPFLSLMTWPFSRAHCRQLTLVGYQALCASAAPKRLEFECSASGSDLLDVTMPGMNGLQFLRSMRCNPGIAATPSFSSLRSLKTMHADAAKLDKRLPAESSFSVEELLQGCERFWFEPRRRK